MSVIDQNTVKSLLHAAEKGDFKKIEACLKKVSVDSKDDQANTALHYAAANGHVKSVRDLIKKGVALDSKNWCGWTAIMFAAYYGHLNIVAILVHNKAEVNLSNDRNATPLTCAARCGHINIIELLLQNGAKANTKDQPDVSPLLAAAQHGHTSIVSLLLQYSSDIDYKNPTTGYTSLMLAASNGHLDVVKLLIEKGGASANLTNLVGQTAYGLSIARRRGDTEKYLSSRTMMIEQKIPVAKATLIAVVRLGKVDLVLKMLSNRSNVNVNATDQDGATPLIYACMCGNIEIVTLLLKAGAKTDVQDNLHGWTALMQAVLKQHMNIVKILLQNGADIMVRDFEGFLAFDLATLVGVPEITRMLVPNNVPGMQRVNSNEREENAKKASWMSKVTDRLGMSKNTSHTFSRIAVQPNDIVGGSTVGNDLVDNEDDSDALKQTSSVLSVLDAAIALKGAAKARFTLVSPQVKLPDDVVCPVLAPYSKLPSFDLPKMSVMKLSSSYGSASEISPSNSSDASMLSSHSFQRHLSRPQSSANHISAPPGDQAPLLNTSGNHPSGMTGMPQFNKSKLPPINVDTRAPLTSNNWQPTNNQQFFTPFPRSPMMQQHRALNVNDMSIRSVSSVNDEDNVEALLRRLSLERYKSVFEDEEVDMECLREMNDVDLKGMGIDETINRDYILNAVKKKKKASEGFTGFKPMPPSTQPGAFSGRNKRATDNQFVR